MVNKILSLPVVEMKSTGPALYCLMLWVHFRPNIIIHRKQHHVHMTLAVIVISGGGGILVLEEMQHALARDAKIYAEITGYGATSDGYDMVKPSGEGAVRCMQQALATVKTPIDYINAHATSTPAGDITELDAIKEVFKEKIPAISATKSLSGHGLGAAGANEAIYTLLMMQHDFISASANVTELDEGAKGMPIILQRQDDANLNAVMSNSFGFGGTNATLVFQRPT
jgi:3-oxoacyl-[acyl-carrier-protein] synthase-1